MTHNNHVVESGRYPNLLGGANAGGGARAMLVLSFQNHRAVVRGSTFTMHPRYLRRRVRRAPPVGNLYKLDTVVYP